jgi:GT2 family glycosyltransferase/glycosyltransferase involved in cell wall biosynthesis
VAAAPEPLPDAAALALEAFERGQAAVAGGNVTEALRWLDRAYRMAPRDPTVALALATASVGQDDTRATALLAELSDKHDVREVWLGLATVRWRLGDAPGAAAALAQCLQRRVADRGLATLADMIVRDARAAGWCGLARNGELAVYPAPGVDPASIIIDPDARARGHERHAGNVAVVTADGVHLLGSPVDVSAIRATVGCVSCREGTLIGWAWHPGDPDIDPTLTIRSADGRREMRVVASDASTGFDDCGLLARPRGFTVTPEQLSGLSGLLHVVGHDGKDLLGSPLDPQMEPAAGAAAAAALARMYPAGHARTPAFPSAIPAAIPVSRTVPNKVHGHTRRPRIVDIVIPIHGGQRVVDACLDSVLSTLPPATRVIVVDDASPEPALAEALSALARQKRVRLIRNSRNLGFAASVNIGLRAAAAHDVVLLNSDTMVPPGWLDELRAVAYGAPDIGTVTPLSNDGSILSYPNQFDANDIPDLAATVRLNALARRANGGGVVEIPVGVGFCLYIKRACLEDVGLLRADVFAQGYGEENDFCLRARALGWRHVAAPGVFVAHVGGHSFGAAARHLRTRNEALLERLHPGYAELVRAYATADPLATPRRRLDLERWKAARRRGGEAVVIITHDAGGGVERQVKASVERHRVNGYRAIVLRPSRAPDDTRCVTVGDGTAGGFPNLRYAMPRELPLLQNLLARERPRAIELHHMVGHEPSVLGLIEGLRLPYDVHVHDYGLLCGRVALVGPAQRYCGEPDTIRCEACVADAGNLIDEDISVAALRQRSARLLAGARHVFVPSADAATRIRRHFPATQPIAVPHEDDAGLPEPPPVPASSHCRVCVVGAIGIHKGYQVVLDCARDAAERSLPLEFVVVGHTIDDGRLMATGRVFVTGAFAATEAVTLIKAQKASLAMLPSIFPETWCLSLGEAWRAGLRVAAFDIGAQAERIRHTGRGFLLPLGLPPHAINNALIAAVGLSYRE